MQLRNISILIIAVALGACAGKPCPPAAPVVPASTEAMPTFVGQAWTAISPERGTTVVFLPNKTVVEMTCSQGFKLSEWGIISPTRIRWLQGSIPIEAEYSQPTADELIISPVGGARRMTFVATSAGYACPK